MRGSGARRDAADGCRMISDKELLTLAGKLAIAAERVLNANARQFGDAITRLDWALVEYDRAMIAATHERSHDVEHR
jgi:hypothetical protein